MLTRFQSQQAWKMLRMPNNMAHHVSLPESNSPAAKQMRCAVILAILAREINKQIFEPTYLFSNENETRDVLDDLAMTDHKKESFFRAVLLSIDPETQARHLEERKEAVVRTMRSYLESLLHPTQLQNVQESLVNIVQRAANTWKRFQYNIEKYEPDFEPLLWNYHESIPFVDVDETGISDGHLPGGARDENVLIIFPRICHVKDGSRTPCNYAVALRRSHCVVAEQECRRMEPSSPTSARGASDRQRARGMSISLQTSNGGSRSFLDGAT
jgi:hypothetical protein